MPTFNKTLNSQLFNIEPCDRLREAAAVPFRSLQTGIDGEPDDLSVGHLQGGLGSIADNSVQLPRKHLPVARATNEPPRFWGPFEFSSFEEGKFQETTFFAVKRFQQQAGLKTDGKAGIKTLERLDEILAFLDTLFL
ncbi:MAG: peptidoglycan-binding protein [Acidobacteriota bacterium]|nr:peptidoglycan-binding protein [Acidobacteriota bacterium]